MRDRRLGLAASPLAAPAAARPDLTIPRHAEDWTALADPAARTHE